MPFSYVIDTDLDAAFIKGEGTITGEELISLGRDLYSDPRFNSEYRLLSDYSQVTGNDLTSIQIGRFSSMNKFSASSRRAILVTRTTEFGVSRMYQSHCSMNDKSFPTIFHTRKEALDYLNHGFPPEKHIK